MVNEMTKKKPVGLIICGIIFVIVGLLSLTIHLNMLGSITTKDQIVKVMEDNLDRAEKTQDYKPSLLQKEYVKAIKDYKVSLVDYVCKIVSIFLDLALFLMAIAIFSNNKWTVRIVNLFLVLATIDEFVENAIFTFIKPLPTPATIVLSQEQKVLLYFQGITPILLIFVLIGWYFNRKKIRNYFGSPPV